MAAQEIEFFHVDRAHYGGSQYWNSHLVMKHGGCSTSTACEISIWLAKSGRAPALFPGDPGCVSKADFLAFFAEVFRYVHPGVAGLTSISKYSEMFRAFAVSRGVVLEADLLEGTAPEEDAARFIIQSIAAGYPVAYLMLNHHDPSFEDFSWHWFTVTGYAETGCDLILTVATYGRRYTMPLTEAWHTGHPRKGGLVSVRPAAV